MAGVRYTLEGSTIIEAIVASVLFMLFFLISIETITRMNSLRRNDSMTEAQMDLNKCIDSFRNGQQEPGEYDMTYRWGDITVSVKQYAADENFLELYFEAKFHNDKRPIRYRIIRPNEYEQR